MKPRLIGLIVGLRTVAIALLPFRAGLVVERSATRLLRRLGAS